MSKIKAYLSHPIMGVNNINATKEYIEANNKKAACMGGYLRTLMPNLELHVPAEHEAFVHRAYTMGFLTIDEILAIDCDIINEVSVILVYNHEGKLSNGMKTEMNYAKKRGITVIEFNDKTRFKDLINSIVNR